MIEIKKNLLSYLSVFSLFFCLFSLIQFSSPNILSPDDAYRHIKEAWLIRNLGVEKSVRNFPWLQCSIFKEHPGDPWFGYHLLLYPFTFGDLVFGAKLSSVFFASLLFLGFFWILKKFEVKYTIFWTALLFLASDSFNFRLLLPRAYILSILFSFIGFYLIFQKKHLGIFILSFLYGFVTVESPLIIFIALALTLLEFLKTKKLDLRPLGFTVSGILAGLIFRPDFPNNFYLISNQIFSVLFLKLKRAPLDFGSELSYTFSGRIIDNPLLFLNFALPLFWIVFVFLQKKQAKISPLLLSLFFFSIFFAFLSFGVGGRFIEYWVPFSTLFSAVCFNNVLLPKISEIIKKIKELKGYKIVFSPEKAGYFYQLIYRMLRRLILKFEEKFIKSLFLGVFLFLFLYLIFFRAMILYTEIEGLEFSEAKLIKEAAIWLRENTPPHSVVLNASWDLFPILLFYNHQNYYCNGMDPTFMYVKSPQNYWLWRNLAFRGLFCNEEKCDEEKQKVSQENVREIIRFLKEKLNGDYILLTARNEKFIDFLNSSKDFEKVFKRGKIEIYKID